VWLDFGYRIRHTLPGNVPVMQLTRDPEHHLGFDQGRFSVYPMFADISDLHREQGDPRPCGSIWWDGMNRHAHVQHMKFYPQWVHVVKAYASSSMMHMPKNHRVCRTCLTQLCNFQVAVQDLHECMAVRSVRTEITVPFTEETLQEQLRVALLHAEECFDRYIVAETLSFDTFFSKCVNGVTLHVCTA